MSVSSPYALLRELDDLGASGRTPLPTQRSRKALWHCVAFALGGTRLLTGMEQITEVVDPPPLIRVPGAKSWLLGVANLRGQLVTVVDLGALVYGAVSAQPLRMQRLLVAQVQGVPVGLVVDRVLGLRRLEKEATPLPEDVRSSALHPYLNGAYRVDGEPIPFLDVTRLLSSGQLLSAAA